MLCALLVFETDELDRQLTEISPWLDAVFDDHWCGRATGKPNPG
jgi:hypothetical protein